MDKTKITAPAAGPVPVDSFTVVIPDFIKDTASIGLSTALEMKQWHNHQFGIFIQSEYYAGLNESHRYELILLHQAVEDLLDQCIIHVAEAITANGGKY